MLNKRVQEAAVLAVLFMAWAVGGSAQGTTGGVGGTLVDSSGLVLPGAAVTLSGPNLQGLRTVTTDGEGCSARTRTTGISIRRSFTRRRMGITKGST
jgi:hypothetical protein